MALQDLPSQVVAFQWISTVIFSPRMLPLSVPDSRKGGDRPLCGKCLLFLTAFLFLFSVLIYNFF